jgi:uncharacterized membrane protein YkvI
MNRLKQRARQEFIGVTVSSIILLICFSFMVAGNAKGASYLVICLIAGVPTALICILKQLKFEKQLDEREIAMYRNANLWSVWAFVGYLLMFCLSVFFLVGGSGQSPVWLFPAMLFSGLLIAQATQSAIILIRCAKEQSDE